MNTYFISNPQLAYLENYIKTQKELVTEVELELFALSPQVKFDSPYTDKELKDLKFGEKWMEEKKSELRDLQKIVHQKNMLDNPLLNLKDSSKISHADKTMNNIIQILSMEGNQSLIAYVLDDEDDDNDVVVETSRKNLSIEEILRI